MPRAVNTHYEAESSVELRGFGYRKVADITAEGAGEPGEIVTSGGVNYQYDSTEAHWRPMPQRFGANSTAGVADFDDATNATHGSGVTLLNGASAANGPASGLWHTFSFEYAKVDGTGNLTQLAIPYGRQSDINAGLWMRGRLGGAWGTWRRIDSPEPFEGTITGNGSSTVFGVTHSLNTSQPQSVTIVEDATGAYAPPLGPSIVIVNANTINVQFASAPANGATYSVKVVA